MFSNVLLLCSLRPNISRKKSKIKAEAKDLHLRYPVTFKELLVYDEHEPTTFSPSESNFITSRDRDHHKPKRHINGSSNRTQMSNKVSNFSDLIQRVTANCLLHPLGNSRHLSGELNPHEDEEEDEEEEEGEGEGKEYDSELDSSVEEGGGGGGQNGCIDQKGWERRRRELRTERLVIGMEILMNDVFDAVSAMKRAYVSLQEAHCPWDPERMRVADVAVVTELKKLGVLRERYRRNLIGHGGGGGGGGGEGRRKGGIGGGGEVIREVVAPYEAALEELRREVKVKEAEVENLKDRLKSVTSLSGNGKKGRSLSKRKVSCSQGQVATSPVPELFEAMTTQVREASKTFTQLLLSLMRSARWDIAAAVRSIEAATVTAESAVNSSAIVGVHHAKFALESYISRKIFQGFDHESFYMDGSLSSLLNPEQYRRECFTQYRDMKAMDPVELLGVLPTCNFGKFCSKKYLSIVHPKMEESFFGNLEQQRQVMDGMHPRTQFYGEFLNLAKAVWLLHLLAFSLDPAPSLFEASRGAEFHLQYMESVVKFSSGRVPAGHIVGFPVSPGFKLGSGSVIKARVYLVSRS